MIYNDIAIPLLLLQVIFFSYLLYKSKYDTIKNNNVCGHAKRCSNVGELLDNNYCNKTLDYRGLSSVLGPSTALSQINTQGYIVNATCNSPTAPYSDKLLRCDLGNGNYGLLPKDEC